MPSTDSADYYVKLLRPIATDKPVKLVARTVEVSDRKAIVEAEMLSEGKIGATLRGTFPVVKPGNPAYHRFGNPID